MNFGQNLGILPPGVPLYGAAPNCYAIYNEDVASRFNLNVLLWVFCGIQWRLVVYVPLVLKVIYINRMYLYRAMIISSDPNQKRDSIKIISFQPENPSILYKPLKKTISKMTPLKL